MKAVILAAGMGTRLGSLIPKPLTSLVDEKTIMDFQVERLSSVFGIHNIIAVVGYKKELIMERFPDISYVYNPAYAHSNTSKSLLRALKTIDDDVVWVNGDVYFDPSILEELILSDTSAIVVDQANCGAEEVKYRTNTSGNVVELSKSVKEAEGEALGLNLVKKTDLANLCEALHDVTDQDYFEKGLEKLASSGRISLTTVNVGTRFCKEIDFPDDLSDVSAALEEVGR